LHSLLARQEDFSVPHFSAIISVLVAAHGRAKISAFQFSSAESIIAEFCGRRSFGSLIPHF